VRNFQTILKRKKNKFGLVRFNKKTTTTTIDDAMPNFTTLEKWLLAGTVVFSAATITLAIVWQLTASEDDVDTEGDAVAQLTLSNRFVFPGRTEPITVKFHSSYEEAPNETLVFATPGEESPLSFGSIVATSEDITVNITRGQLHTAPSKFSGPTYTGCAAYQFGTQIFSVFFQTDYDLFLSEFSTNQKTYTDPKSVLNVSPPLFGPSDGPFSTNRLIALSPTQFVTATSGFVGSFLLVGIVSKDGTSTIQDLAPSVSSIAKVSVAGFENNIMFIDRAAPATTGAVYHSVYPDITTPNTWSTPVVIYPQPPDATIIPEALGTYVMPGKPNIMVVASTNVTNTRLQGFLQPAGTTGDWTLSSFIDLTTLYDINPPVQANLYLTENTAGTEVSIAFMSGPSTLIMVRVSRDLSNKVQEKIVALPAVVPPVAGFIYHVLNILTYNNEAGDEEVQVMLRQGDAVVSLIFDSTLAVRDGGDMLSVMSAAGAAGFAVGTSAIPNGQVQVIVQVQDQVNTKSSFQVAVASWSPSVSVSVFSEQNAIPIS
jgi:hypothetical protein